MIKKDDLIGVNEIFVNDEEVEETKEIENEGVIHRYITKNGT